jgi:MYXO-CTERM domain-containing protein
VGFVFSGVLDMMFRTRLFLSAVLVGLTSLSVQADPVNVTVTIQNLAPTNSVSFAPLRLGFGNGTFDAFNIGQTATAPIISVAEGGSASAWFPAFRAAEPNAVLGSVGGALLPGATASNTFLVDSSVNRFFTFGAMVIPSNDLFIGNDSPTRFQLFDANGNLALTSINQKGRDIWNAGSEVADPLNAAFVVGGNNDLRRPENGVVEFSFSELSVFNGVTTRGGYVFDTQITNDSDIYRITFAAQPVPAPPAAVLGALGFAVLGFVRRRRNRGAVAVAAA